MIEVPPSFGEKFCWSLALKSNWASALPNVLTNVLHFHTIYNKLDHYMYMTNDKNSPCHNSCNQITVKSKCEIWFSETVTNPRLTWSQFCQLLKVFYFSPATRRHGSQNHIKFTHVCRLNACVQAPPKTNRNQVGLGRAIINRKIKDARAREESDKVGLVWSFESN